MDDPAPRAARNDPGRFPSTARRWCTLAIAGAMWWLLAAAAHAAPVVVLQVREAIGPANADYLVKGLDQAHRRGAPLVVVELDTPGGLDTSMRRIIQAILASPVPVATYVSPEGARAASAGTFILYASHVAAMAPSTTLGAATPVALGAAGGESTARPASGPQAPADTMTAKQVHDAAAFIRGLAQQRGRNAEWAERAVREAVSLTATEALQAEVIDVVARDLPDLLAQVDGRVVRMRTGEARLATRGVAHELVLPDGRQRLLSVITNPSVALILMTLGIYGLIFEFSSPGFGVPGVVGAICLLLALFALQMLPVNYAGLALLALGLGLMAAELVTPALGIFGVGGAIAFVAGGILMFDRDVPGLGVPAPLLIGLAAASMMAVIGVGGLALRSRRRPVRTGMEQMIDAPGEVLESDGHEAWARVRGERWRVRSDVPLERGQHVRVKAMRGLTLEVVPDTGPMSTKGDLP